MGRWAPVILLSVALCGAFGLTRPSEPDAKAPAARFAFFDVYVDSAGEPLGAYQFEWSMGPGAQLVGVEGGAGPAYSEAPYYDPRALMGDRVIVGALAQGDEIPSGRVRVARLHVRLENGEDPAGERSLDVASTPAARPIPGASLVIEKGQA